jgi:hypothetical protein
MPGCKQQTHMLACVYYIDMCTRACACMASQSPSTFNGGDDCAPRTRSHVCRRAPRAALLQPLTQLPPHTHPTHPPTPLPTPTPSNSLHFGKRLRVVLPYRSIVVGTHQTHRPAARAIYLDGVGDAVFVGRDVHAARFGGGWVGGWGGGVSEACMCAHQTRRTRGVWRHSTALRCNALQCTAQHTPACHAVLAHPPHHQLPAKSSGCHL